DWPVLDRPLNRGERKFLATYIAAERSKISGGGEYALTPCFLYLCRVCGNNSHPNRIGTNKYLEWQQDQRRSSQCYILRLWWQPWVSRRACERDVIELRPGSESGDIPSPAWVCGRAPS